MVQYLKFTRFTPWILSTFNDSMLCSILRRWFYQFSTFGLAASPQQTSVTKHVSRRREKLFYCTKCPFITTHGSCLVICVGFQNIPIWPCDGSMQHSAKEEKNKSFVATIFRVETNDLGWHIPTKWRQIFTIGPFQPACTCTLLNLQKKEKKQQKKIWFEN